MKAIPKGGRYTWEFRRKSAKLAIEDKISCREAAQRLSLAPSTLAYWVKAYKEGKLGEVKMEREILKKKLRTLPGSRCTVSGDEADATLLPRTAP